MSQDRTWRAWTPFATCVSRDNKIYWSFNYHYNHNKGIEIWMRCVHNSDHHSQHQHCHDCYNQCNFQVSVSWVWVGLPIGLTSAGIKISCIFILQSHHFSFDQHWASPLIAPHQHLPFAIAIIISHPLQGLYLWSTLDILDPMKIICDPPKSFISLLDQDSAEELLAERDSMIRQLQEMVLLYHIHILITDGLEIWSLQKSKSKQWTRLLVLLQHHHSHHRGFIKTTSFLMPSSSSSK